MSDSQRTTPAEGRPAAERSNRGRQIMGLVLVVLILLLALSTYLLFSLSVAPRGTGKAAESSSSSNGVTWVRSIYGTSNRMIDMFGQTQAAVPGNDGSIWVTDTKTRALMHFTADGHYLGAVRSVDPSAPLAMPSRMAVDSNGLIYVCETTQDAVRVLRPDGTDAGSFGIPKPVSVAVSKDRIAVGCVPGFAILDKKGNPIKVIGNGRGKGEDQFDYVHGVAFDNAGNVYVSDSYNNRLSAYDRNGKRLWIIKTGSPANDASYTGGMLAPKETTGTALKGQDALQLPLGVTVDGAGRLVVSDMYDSDLALFETKTGKFIGKFGDVGADDGQFFYPVSVSYDAGHDWFTVADAFNRRVQIIRLPGSSSAGIAGGVAAAARRSLAGPLRACLFPLALLLLAIAALLISRFAKRRHDKPEPDAGDGLVA